ncbi:MAG TPA: S41 family peptidase, partial [Bryobacteraceae bacterium]|nr:S41 family peptidase [Bryobacteraceae bacterium]
MARRRLSLALAALLAYPAAAEDVESHLKNFVQLMEIVRTEAAESPDQKKAFYEGAIPGMLRQLDPHSVFFDPDQFEQLKEMEKSTRKGFGTVVSLLPGRVIVLQTVAGSPSAKAGIQPGDEILAINNIALQKLEVEQLVQLLGQARQQKVQLYVRRPGSLRILDFTLTPEDVDSPSVDRVFLLRPGIGYVRATSFDMLTGKQIREAIEKLGGADLKGLVLDLRNNPGGVLAAALETASLFLEPGQRIISARGRNVQKAEEIDVPKDAPKPYKFPLVLLVNGKSASGS